MKLTDFDRIHMMALDSRRNDWRKVDKQFGKRGTKIEKFIVGKGHIFPAKEYNQIDGPPVNWGVGTSNAYWCYQAHRKMFQSALNDGIQNLLLLEDDVVLNENFDEVLEAVSKQMNNLGIADTWDTFHLTANYTWGKVKSISENIVQLVGGNYCFHIIALKRHMFQVMLDAPELGPMDLIHSQIIQPNYKCFGIWPAIAPQKDAFSYVNERNETYSQYFQNKGQFV